MGGNRRALTSVGVPDASLFIYGDDWDYSLTLRKAGFRIFLDPAFRYVHDITSQPTGNARYASLWQLYYSCRNGVILQRRHLGILAKLSVPLRRRAWLRQATAYPNPDAARRTVHRAVRDGLDGDTSRSLEEIRLLTETES